MDELESIDLALFRFVHLGLKNPAFDWLMPYFSSNPFFVPALVALGIWLALKGGIRARLLVFFLVFVLSVGDGLILNSLKHFVARPRPFLAMADVQLLVGRGHSASMPSNHAGNWFSAGMVVYALYGRRVWFLVPVALIVCFSRVYLGVHYPGDVMAGAVIGLAYAALILWLFEAAWRWAGPRWFPIWHAAVPSLLDPDGARRTQASSKLDSRDPATELPGRGRSLDQHWKTLAYLVIGASLFVRLAYLAAGKIQLSEDEAYQWLWSKHLDLSYFSKPPLIAYTQALGTTLWGDSEFGVRFFAPVLGALGGWLVVRFLAREVNGRAALLLAVATVATPLLVVGSTLLTIDSLSVLFWVAAMVSGWKAVQEDSTGAWLWTGLWIGLGFLSKYIGFFQWLCWGVFFLLWPAARAQLRRPGPYLALAISLVALLPVAIWNAQHDWITVSHLADRGGLDQAWQPTTRYLTDFLVAEMGLLNPIFFVGFVWAAVTAWRRHRREAFLVYLFSMGVPLVLFYLLYTLRGRVQPNWIAPAVLPLFCLMVIDWEKRWRNGSRLVMRWFAAAVVLGLLVTIPLHAPRLLKKATAGALPAKFNPLRRVLGWQEAAAVVDQARSELAKEGKPVFVIGDHYGITSTLSFYIPDAREGLPATRLVYYQSSDRPKNQFWFWPGYQMRKGENAVYVARVKEPDACPARLQREFRSVTDLGVQEIRQSGVVFHKIQLFACRELL
ncbi:MAG: glycosyltransferase family 39 protein [Verrucomicrobiia bacterium]